VEKNFGVGELLSVAASGIKINAGSPALLTSTITPTSTNRQLRFAALSEKIAYLFVTHYEPYDVRRNLLDSTAPSPAVKMAIQMAILRLTPPLYHPIHGASLMDARTRRRHP
jgi:hypothetical protein